MKKTRNSDRDVTISLVEPIEWGSEQIEKLTLRPPRAKDMREVPGKPKTGHLLDLAAKLSGQPKTVIDELCMPDMESVLKAVGDFFDGGQKTGEKH